MSDKKVFSEEGFGLISVLLTLLIVSIAVAGLFVSVHYANSKALENYHFRAALLQASGRMDLIRSRNIGQGDTPVNLSFVPGLYNQIILDERDGNSQPLVATLNVTQRQVQDEVMSLNHVVYDEIVLKLSWREGPLNVFNDSQNQNKIKTIILREDYFRRNAIGG
jgi:hypothetical protein